MGIRLMPGTDVYEYRFQIAGVKYQGSTGATNQREALRSERAAKEAAKHDQLLQGKRQSGAGMSLKNAVGKYLKAQEAKSYINRKTFCTEVKAFKWIVATIGPDVQMSDLDLKAVAEMVEKRRELPRTNSKGEVLFDEHGRPLPVSSSYVNRYTWKLLKRVYIAARDEWHVPVKPIKWSSDQIALPEAQPRKSEIKLEDEGRIIAHKNFREGYGSAFRFSLLAGMRKENFTALKWSEVDFGNREIKFWIKGRKGRKEHTISIDDEMLSILLAERGKHPIYVFTYICQRTRKNPKTGADEVKGERRPITYWGFTSWYRNLTSDLKLDLTIHDIRRTTGSRIVRRTGNLKAASSHLGHSDIAVTAKHYAHVQSDDMLAVLNRKNAGTREAKETMSKLFGASKAA